MTKIIDYFNSCQIILYSKSNFDKHRRRLYYVENLAFSA